MILLEEKFLFKTDLQAIHVDPIRRRFSISHYKRPFRGPPVSTDSLNNKTIRSIVSPKHVSFLLIERKLRLNFFRDTWAHKL